MYRIGLFTLNFPGRNTVVPHRATICQGNRVSEMKFPQSTHDCCDHFLKATATIFLWWQLLLFSVNCCQPLCKRPIDMNSLYLLGSSNYTKNMYAHFTRNTIIFSLKIFRRFWLAPIPPGYFSTGTHHNYLEDVSNIPSTRWYKLWYTIDQPPFQARQPSFLSTSELEIKRRSRPSKDEIAKFLKLNGRHARIRNKYRTMDVIYLLSSICKV